MGSAHLMIIILSYYVKNDCKNHIRSEGKQSNRIFKNNLDLKKRT